MKHALISLLATTCALTAQSVALADGSERHVVLFDVADVLGPEPGKSPSQPPRFATTRALQLQDLVRFARTFAPALTDPGADLQPLGDRHLVALGTPAQTDAFENLLRHRRAHPDAGFRIDLRVCRVPAAVFAAEVDRKLPRARDSMPGTTPRPRATVLTAEVVHGLVGALKQTPQVGITQAPQIVADPLRLAHIAVGHDLPYVRDIDVEVVNAAFTLKPVHGAVWDGFHAKVMCGLIRDGATAVLLDFCEETVTKPIAEHTVSMPGSTSQLTVQTPEVTGYRGEQTVELRSGETAVMAVQKADGDWLLSLLTVDPIRSSEPMVLPRPR